MRTLASIVGIVFFSLVLVPSVHAQTSHVASQSILDAAVQEHVDNVEADREAVMRLLDREDVRTVAGDLGLDLRRMETAIATLEGQPLADVVAQAQRVEQALAGGQSRVVISTTLIIIALLVLILIVVAVD